MRIAIVGHRNHAARIRGLAAQNPTVEQIVVFHPDAKRIEGLAVEPAEVDTTATSDFEQVLECDAVLICSPSDTHRHYLELLQGRNIYTFCEKPIATAADDLDWLTSLSAQSKRKIYCNHNYAESGFCRQALELIGDGGLGIPTHLHATATHGLAFNPSFASNWRFRTRDPFASIVGNLGIHYLHMVLCLFGEPVEIACLRSRVNAECADADTCTIQMRCAGGQTVHIYLSYAAPYQNSARLVFADGMLELDDGRLRLYSPRDSFDPDGRFATPPHQEIAQFDSSKAYYDDSLVRSLDAFFAVAVKGHEFSEEPFGRAVRSAQLVHQMCSESGAVRDVS